MKTRNIKTVFPKQRDSLFYLGMFLVILLFSQCARPIHKIVYPTLSDNRYDSEFPYRNCSHELEKVFRAVKKISFMVRYETFFFDISSQTKLNDLRYQTFKEKAFQKEFYNSSGFGTSTIIHQSMDRLILLTCAHVVSHPDTLITFHQTSENQSNPFIQSVAIKKSQKLFISDSDVSGYLEILALDKMNDIAFMEMKRDELDVNTPVLNYPTGKTSDLEWGSFVYVLGYPVGYPMITRGIVSRGSQDKKCFLVDTNFNRGFSGGIVLAVRDGVPNFELVGMVKSVSVQTEYVLRPEKDYSEYQYDLLIPYEGYSYVQINNKINYGVTHAVCIETIRELYQKNKSHMEEKGYFLSNLFE